MGLLRLPAPWPGLLRTFGLFDCRGRRTAAAAAVAAEAPGAARRLLGGFRRIGSAGGLRLAGDLLLALDLLRALRLFAPDAFLLCGQPRPLRVGLLLCLDLRLALRRFTLHGFPFALGPRDGFGGAGRRRLGDHLSNLGAGRRRDA
jgi:hypothetical protein